MNSKVINRCRADGRCQYAIDVGMDGEAYCHPTCCDPSQRAEVPGYRWPDWPAGMSTFSERKAYQRGIADARLIASQQARSAVDCGEAGHAEGRCGNASCIKQRVPK